MARQRIVPRFAAVTVIALVAVALGGCGSGRLNLDPSEMFSGFGGEGRAASGAEGGFTVTRGAVEAQTRAVTASDLVGADGQCQGGTPAGARVGLTATECEVVAAAGVPEQVSIGASESGDRRVVLTYTKGDHPGIYTFVSGRLRIMERVAPSRPEPRRRASKKKSA